MNRDPNSTLTVKCPTCQKMVEWSENSPFRPFCSKRCQLIDLGEWAAESHRIPDKGSLELWSESEHSLDSDQIDRGD